MGTENGQEYYVGNYVNGILDRESVRCFIGRTDRQCSQQSNRLRQSQSNSVNEYADIMTALISAAILNQ